ncbi:MAG TPA: hypothetical protein VE777_15470 [Gaiellales bacterium]|nr:hypothetical protein [Gaiellales bacterium]
MATMADLDRLALQMPQTTKEVSADGRPAYLVHGKLFCCHRGRRPDAVDPETGERLDDVLMFRVPGLEVKELLLGEECCPGRLDHFHHPTPSGRCWEPWPMKILQSPVSDADYDPV